ncbi:MAG: ribosome maturation factor RimM [Polyangiaceae bacterium]|nr:ribosome maturation factor RimM [Polyangiaceae bacterium]
MALGRVTRPHGVRGELKVELYNPASEVLFERPDVWIKAGEAPPRKVQIVAIRRADKQLLVTFDGVLSRDAADAFRGSELLVERSALPALEEGEYYLADLIGATVLGPDGKQVGIVVEIANHPSMDTALVHCGSGEMRELLLGEHWVERVDPVARVIELRTLDGLLEA